MTGDMITAERRWHVLINVITTDQTCSAFDDSVRRLKVKPDFDSLRTEINPHGMNVVTVTVAPGLIAAR